MSWEDEGDPQRREGLGIKERTRTERPKKYKVLLHNDDYTTMEFVVHVLMHHFHKNHAEATHVMLKIHHSGKGVAGIYTKDMAQTKVRQVTAEARVAGMPLKLSMEPE